MRRASGVAKHANHERWLVSYADFITLLFAFFVVLYASSQVDKRKVGRLASGHSGCLSGDGSISRPPLQPCRSIWREPMPFARRKLSKTETHRRRSAGSHRIPQELSAPAEAQKTAIWRSCKPNWKRHWRAEIKRKEIAMRREPDGLVISLTRGRLLRKWRGADEIQLRRPPSTASPACFARGLSFADRGSHR